MRDETNLLTETLDKMRYNGQSPETVLWVGDAKVAGNWEDFAKLADFTYDAGYGGQRINESLIVAFTDGSWLERHEYDGSEWWEYKKTPTPSTFDTLTNRRQLKNSDYD